MRFLIPSFEMEDNRVWIKHFVFLRVAICIWRKTVNTANRGDDDGAGATRDALINTSDTWEIRSRCMYDDAVWLFN